jgi:hypothetical protein
VFVFLKILMTKLKKRGYLQLLRKYKGGLIQFGNIGGIWNLSANVRRCFYFNHKINTKKGKEIKKSQKGDGTHLRCQWVELGRVILFYYFFWPDSNPTRLNSGQEILIHTWLDGSRLTRSDPCKIIKYFYIILGNKILINL